MTSTKERKNKCDSKHNVFSHTNLKGSTLLSDSEITQKSRDSILLIGARVPEKDKFQITLVEGTINTDGKA
jgi:hypothetical protein